MKLSVVQKVNPLPGVSAFVQRWLYLYRKRLRPIKRKFEGSLRKLTPWVLAITLSLGLGAAIVTQSPARVVGEFALLFLLWVVFAHTDVAVLIILALVASFVNEAAIPKPFEAGGMGFYLSELLLILTTFVVFVKVHFIREKDSYLRSPLTLPVLAVLGSVGISILVSYSNWLANPRGPFDFKTAYNWARPMIYMLLFFACAYSIDTEKKLRRAIGVLLILSIIVSLLIIAQQVKGYDTPIFKWMMSWYRGSGDNPGEIGDDLRLRLEAPGLHTMLLVALIAFVLSAVYRIKNGIWYFASVIVIGVALVVTWQRNYWVAIMLGVLIIAFFSTRHVKWKLALVTMAWLMTMAVGYQTIAIVSGHPTWTKTMEARIASVFTPKETFQTKSLQWRLWENREALKVIRANPVFGLGVGQPILHVTYRGPGGIYLTETRYRIHNSYLMIYATYGLFGLLSCAWLAVAFILRVYKLYRRSHSTYIKVLAISFLSTFIGFLFRAVFNQMSADRGAIAILAFMLGATEVCWRITLQAESQTSLGQQRNMTPSSFTPQTRRRTGEATGGSFGKG